MIKVEKAAINQNSGDEEYFKYTLIAAFQEIRRNAYKVIRHFFDQYNQEKINFLQNQNIGKN